MYAEHVFSPYLWLNELLVVERDLFLRTTTFQRTELEYTSDSPLFVVILYLRKAVMEGWKSSATS